ncbi:MAG: NAD-dependent epimerase/dehydratase family protein [Actinomycetota bacterium]|nr:NAD-dependent epimerase/dehydratase family protein [Actinomycetota bacterium]
MTTVLVTGAAGELGSRVVAALCASPDVSRVVAVDRVRVASGRQVSAVVLDVETQREQLTASAAEAEVVVHLAWTDPPEHGADPNRAVLDSVLHATAAAGVEHFVLVSSATVYGAWANAVVPVPEVTALRPNPTFTYATVKAEHERVVGLWRKDEGVGVTVLRPTAAVAEQTMSWLGNAIMNAAAIRADVADPPTQFLHVDDLASAVVTAVEQRLDGPYNVAPDGWLSGRELRALLGPRPRLRLPVPVAERVQAWLSRRQRRPPPVGLLPYTMYPWVVANDRLRKAGWVPTTSNAEAFVEADQAPPWVALNAKQRQYASLGIVGAVVFGVVGLVGFAIRRRSRAAH